MSTARLVVNADDLGLHPRIDEGILRAHAEGIVTSATVLVTGVNARTAVKAALKAGLGLGVHLSLVGGLAPALPASALPTLAPGGRLRRSWSALVRDTALGRVRRSELRAELEAQLALARDTLGFEPDHLDTHQHLHLLPGIASEVERLAAEHHLPLRWPAEPLPPLEQWRQSPGAAAKTVVLTTLAKLARPGGAERVLGHGLLEAGRLDEPMLLAILDRLGPGFHELGCHPGLTPESVPEDPDWRYGWEGELAALTSDAVKRRLSERGIQLCRYSELREGRRAS